MSEPTHPPKLLDQVRHALRCKHYSIRTEDAYVGWIKRYMLFHDKRHPRDMGAPEVETYLTHLAVDVTVAASTQYQALAALLFLYANVLNQPLEGSVLNAVRAKPPQRLTTVLSRDEVRRLLDELSGIHRLHAQLLYGSGMRLLECLRLRVTALAFTRRSRLPERSLPHASQLLLPTPSVATL